VTPGLWGCSRASEEAKGRHETPKTRADGGGREGERGRKGERERGGLFCFLRLTEELRESTRGRATRRQRAGSDQAAIRQRAGPRRLGRKPSEQAAEQAREARRLSPRKKEERAEQLWCSGAGAASLVIPLLGNSLKLGFCAGLKAECSALIGGYGPGSTRSKTSSRWEQNFQAGFSRV